MSSQRSQKRKQPASAAKECANPLFEKWITEWRDDAVSKNSKLQYVYSKALASLRRYPLLLSSGRECQILENFGPGICNQIDSRISKEDHLIPRLQGSSVPTVIDLDDVLPGTKKAKKAKTSKNNQEEDEQPDAASSSKKKTTKRTYIPAFRSGSYALLITLFRKEATPNYRGYMLRSELLQEAQDHCDASMTSNPNGQYATAWNGMATLVTKDLVIKKGNPVKYLLSIDGRELAAKLINADGRNASGRSHAGDTDDEAEEVSGPVQRVRFEPNEFEVLLCVDTSETNAKSRKEEVLGELKKNGVPVEVVRLSVGDFVWICRKLQNLNSGTNRRLTVSRSTDMMLPYVVERKRTDDLASSIKDGRFHEQKHRLEQTGLEPIYLIESYSSGGDFGLAEGALMQGVANTQITNRFIIQETDSLKDTCAYLTHMTRHLSRMYQGKSVSSCTKEEWPTFKGMTDTTYLMSFSDFNEFGTKSRNWTVSEMFARHLMKVRGLSAERAFGIIQQYPTVADLLRAYRNCSSIAEQQSLIASIRYGTAGKTVGQAISKIIHSLYTSMKLG